jgi:hypothetical protein
MDAARWGLPTAAVETLPERLQHSWSRYRQHFWTRTRDQGAHGYAYLSGLLRMQAKRTYSGIAREAGESSENVQHFMSNSPWSGRALIQQVQQEVTAVPTLSVANVRELLHATMPLRQLSLTEAQDLVCEHLLNRTRARRSRFKNQFNILRFHSINLV